MAESINQLASQSIWDAGGAPVQSEVALHISSAVSETDEMKMSVREPEGLELSRASSAQDEALALPLIRRLCSSLRERGVVYCHWKSNWKLADWLRGEGDLDLLVDRADAQAFASVLYSLGFKQAEPSSDRQMPGILNYYGFDVEANRFVHLHVHYQLVLGHDLTKNFRLPIEKLYLESAARRDFIPIPAPELELILFTLRMVLKYSAAEAGIGRALGRSKVGGSALVRELDYLEARADIIKVRAILEQHLSFIDTAFFDRCMGSLRAGSPVWTRTVVRRELKKHLKAHARRPQTADTLVKIGRRAARVLRERLLGQSSRKRLVNSGALIALVGGDGAGKTTSVNQLHGWLSKKFVVRRFHLGKPPRSPLTLCVLVALRVRRFIKREPSRGPRAHSRNVYESRNFPGYLQMFRWVLAARDRQRVYVKARRFATNGGIAICDRYVVPELLLMDGPNIARSVALKRSNPLIRFLLNAEMKYYRHILPPDLLIVLRVDPDIAVQRKTSEHESHVRTRSQELWEVDWRETRAHVVDAGQPVEDITAQVRSLVWASI